MYHYYVETERWSRHTGSGDVRATRPPKGWDRMAVLLDEHPITWEPFKKAQWWFRDTYVGD